MAQFKVQSKVLQDALATMLDWPEYIQTVIHHATDNEYGLRLELEYRDTRLEAMDPNRIRFTRVMLA